LAREADVNQGDVRLEPSEESDRLLCTAGGPGHAETWFLVE
jgi:hypothetical protein